ncbi:hypothetical protein [Nitrococcus mobilis]|nr:hypothetical protein [Nitrococcus mobilis]
MSADVRTPVPKPLLAAFCAALLGGAAPVFGADEMPGCRTIHALQDAIEEHENDPEYQRDQAIYAFLQREWQRLSQHTSYRFAKWRLSKLNERRASDDGVKYMETCAAKRPLVLDAEKQFCTDFRKKDAALLARYNEAKRKFEDYVAAYIAGEERRYVPDTVRAAEYVGLGSGGKPLATNLTEFVDAHRRARLAVAGVSAKIAQLNAQLDKYRDKYPEVVARCARSGD